MKRRGAGLSPIQMLALGFAAIILFGALLLSLPIANRNGEALTFYDSLFTATSATCVTGLIVRDTYTQFSWFGQFVILLLIQIGGLGFMTIAVFLSMAAGKRIGLKERSILMEAVSSMQLGGVVKLVKRILFGTLIVEGLGALLLSFRFVPLFGWAEGIWCGIFHSISAFCIAGFDILGRIEPYCSLHYFANDITVNLVIAALILIGGIGFVVWDDIAQNGLHFSKYRLHTKIMLSATLCLLIIPALMFFFLESKNAFYGMSTGEKIVASLFQAVTPRTAGFETVGMSELSTPGNYLVTLLMIIGGGAGSTAGGVKVSTVVAVLLSALAYLQKREDVNAFKRRIDSNTLRKALCAIIIYLISLVTACFILTILEKQPLQLLMFETASALGTVGLTMGITGKLLPLSRFILMLLMYTGRIGSLSVAMAVFENRSSAKVRLPEEKIIV